MKKQRRITQTDIRAARQQAGIRDTGEPAGLPSSPSRLTLADPYAQGNRRLPRVPSRGRRVQRTRSITRLRRTGR